MCVIGFVSRWKAVFIFGMMAFALIGCKQDPMVKIGNVDDFYVRGVPHLIYHPPGYLVNLEGEFHFFIPYPTDDRERRKGCVIKWVPSNERYEDICGYGKFLVDGTVLYGLSKRDLDEYPVKVVDGAVMVDPTTIIKGECRIVPQEPDPNNLEATPPPCNPS